MSTEGVTVKTNVVRNHVLYISSETMSMLRALVQSQADDPLLAQVDAIGDALLRERLEQIPALVERQKAIRAFYKQLPPLWLRAAAHGCEEMAKERKP